MCLAFHGWKKEPLKIPKESCRWLTPLSACLAPPSTTAGQEVAGGAAGPWKNGQQGLHGHSHHPSPSVPQSEATVLLVQRCIFGFQFEII